MSLEDYRAFIRKKTGNAVSQSAINGATLPSQMKRHQTIATDFALERGRSALFLDTGLGKSFCQLAWAEQVVLHTKRPVLILTPLAVAAQMVREGQKFGIECRQVRTQDDVWEGVNVANYERLKHLDPSMFGGVALDESSILKSFTGTTRKALQAAFYDMEFRLALTATPAPNDHMELGQHAEFLGVMPSNEMLARWFISDQTKMGAYKLKGHAVGPFWEWVASWARAAVMPSDLGGDDTGYDLKPVSLKTHVVEVDQSVGAEEGMLFRFTGESATDMHREKLATMNERCGAVAELSSHERPVTVWCERNDESALISKMVDGAVELRGDMKPEQKEEIILAFSDGEIRALVTKPKLAGFGVNWQHCSDVVFASITHSYEQFYQALRRSHRFGQDRQVSCSVVMASTERHIWSNLMRKRDDHETMKQSMRKAMAGAQRSSELHKRLTVPKIEFPEWLKGETYETV